MKDYLGISGKAAIVTGSGRGIGQGVAEALAEYGVRVMVCDINDENGEAVVAGIRAKGGTAEYCHCDIMQTEQINALIARTVEVFGTVDFLINNGGGGEAPRDFFDLDDARFDHYVRLNLYSAFAAIRAAFPYMRKQNSGRIVTSAPAMRCAAVSSVRTMLPRRPA